jgi:hypothetical protein
MLLCPLSDGHTLLLTHWMIRVFCCVVWLFENAPHLDCIFPAALLDFVLRQSLMMETIQMHNYYASA